MPQEAVGRDKTLKEYESVTVPFSRLSRDDLDRLRKLSVVNITKGRSGYVLKARTTTGVLQLSQIRLILQPKFPIAGTRLIDWLCYANEQGKPDEALRNWPLGKDGYAGLVPAALLHECRLLLRRGLRRDYVRRQRVGTSLRGRLDVEAQATRCYGAVDRLHVQTFEYEDGGWENLVCGAALTTAAERSLDPHLSRQLAAAARDFPSPVRPLDALALLSRGRYTRLNSHYRGAHAWARMMLGGGGVADLLDPYGFGAKSLLLKLDDLWESVVRRMAVEAAVGAGGRRAQAKGDYIRTSGRLGDRTPTFLPDVLLAFDPPAEEAGATRFLAVDAKYKDYAKKNVSREDRHQLLTYIAGYTGPEQPLALVVHPAPDGPTEHILEFKGPRGLLGRIQVLGLDTRTDPQSAAEPLREAIAGFAAQP
ncbi:McrC family protein [Streptantibioticus rubrisoli]|uniref:McrC family protein n=1 Tax=Streptantibioticus rubrisoli TaxID=1387313 RepID=A0ABT1PD18_9ACTN|nr:McrC family protein [Streptantibioticus rubrisoli]MCQ4043254.1 McrC family protein [Streptantibioticus rubrisoli]